MINNKRFCFKPHYYSFLLFFCTMLVVGACKKDDDSEPTPTPNTPTHTITITPATTHQQMIGFGGALTWYSTWLTNSPHKNTVADLLFTDLGIDIIRFKSWYYPDGYPEVTSTASMSDDNSKVHWDATNELYTLAKNRNPNVKILLSSWGPPAALKSNNNSRQGTLKKVDGKFVYGDFAKHWEQTLEHLPFTPDYISIQNEPTFLNAGWTTCQWSSAETATLPDYMIAFDSVYNRIKDIPNAPVMIGPESQDIPTYAAFANKLKDKAHCGALAYHPYNVNSSTSSSQIMTGLQGIGAINAKPNIMTEFADNLNWINTAQFIQSTLIHANTSGYIYWKLTWDTPTSGTDAALVSMSNGSGSQYTVTPYYYLIKHFSKHIDAGYQRVTAASAHGSLVVSAFKNPGGNKLTVIIVNPTTSQVRVDFKATGQTTTALQAFQSKEGSYYQQLTASEADDVVVIAASSITTVVLDL